jgi:drug/metabolite transporter (DMT)-like permease
VWWRLLITVAALWILFYLQKKIHKISWQQFALVAGIGTLLSIHWLFFYGSIKQANVSIALTCLATSGLFSAIIEPLAMRQKIKLQELLFGAIALAGITIIYSSNLHFSVGIYYGLAASLFTVLVSVANKKYVMNIAPETVTLYQLTGGFFGLTILLPFYCFATHESVTMPSGLDFFYLFLLAFVCTIFTFTLYIKALKKLSAFTVNLSLTLEPIYGIILAFILYKENNHLGKYFYVGFALIAIAVLLQMALMVRSKSLAQQ